LATEPECPRYTDAQQWWSTREWSQRSFVRSTLTGGLGLGAASLAMPGPAGASTAARSQDPSRAPAPAGTSPAPGATAPAQRYSLSTLTELSEDYFLVQNHPINPAADTIMAYSRTDGQVEAVVLQGGVVKQLYRDPTQPGGWNAYPLPGATGVTSMVAGISGPFIEDGHRQGAGVLKVFYLKSGSPGVLNVAVETTAPANGADPVYTTSTVPWSKAATAQALQLAVNYDASLLVTAMSVSGLTSNTAQLWYWADGATADHETGLPMPISTGYLTGFNFLPLIDPGTWAAVVGLDVSGDPVPTIFLWLPGIGQSISPKPAVGIYSAQLKSGTHTAVPVFNLRVTYGPVPSPPDGLDVVGVASLNPLGSELLPTALVWTGHAGSTALNPALWALTHDSYNHQTWKWTPLALPADIGRAELPPVMTTAVRPSPSPARDGVGALNLLDTFVLHDDTASVVRQAATGDPYQDAVAPQYTPYLPLHADVAMVVSQAGVSTGNELLVVRKSDSMLTSLEKDPVTGLWADHDVHLPSADLQQVNTYRVTLTLTDQWNAVAPDRLLSVTASTAALANVNDQVVTLGPAATTFTTDAQGMAQIALVADGLSAPTLTVTGADLTAPVTVYPSQAVNTYFSGSGTLNYLDTMSVPTLQGARDDSNNALAPGAGNTGDAQTAITNMSSAATWGADGSKAGEQPTTANPGAFGAPIVGGVIGDLGHWATDVFHAIKTGAVAVGDVTRDVASKTFTIACDVAEWAGKAIQIVVKTIEDAAHVLHAVLRKLLADIVKIIKWLAAEILDLLKDSVDLANQYVGWIGDCATLVSGQLTDQESYVKKWLGQQGNWLSTQFRTLASNFDPSITIGTYQTSNPALLSASAFGVPPLAAPTLAPPALGAAAPASFHSPHATWLVSKILNLIGGSVKLPADSDFDTDLLSFGSGANSGPIGTLVEVYKGFWGFLEGAIKDPADIPKLGLKDLLLALADLVDAFVKFVDSLLDKLTAMLSKALSHVSDILENSALNALGLLGKLLKLIGLEGPTIGQVVMLMFAFPAVLAYKTAHGGKGRPFGGSQLAAPRQAVGDLASDMQLCASSALFLWATFDTINAAFTVAGGEAPFVFTVIDIAAPLLVGVLTIPSTRNGEPYFTPPVDHTAAGALNFVAWVFSLLPSGSVAASAKIDTIDKKQLPADTAKTYKTALFWLTCVCGVVCTVTGCVGNKETSNPKGQDYTEDVLNNMANTIAPLLMDDLVEASDGLSALIACALTWICGTVGAILYGVEG
jgi:hypothetical protein